MFTGLIEEVGTIRNIKRGTKSCVLTVGCKEILKGTKVGDSIATNGVCLTVTELGSDYYTVDVMPETLDRSSLGQLQTGSRVNTERAMAADGRFGGRWKPLKRMIMRCGIPLPQDRSCCVISWKKAPLPLMASVLLWHMWMTIALKYPSSPTHDRRQTLWTKGSGAS